MRRAAALALALLLLAGCGAGSAPVPAETAEAYALESLEPDWPGEGTSMCAREL